MHRVFCTLLILCLAVPVTLAQAVRGDKAMYIGGTVTSIPDNQQGKLDTSGESQVVFAWDKGNWQIPFKSLTKMEYGQKAGRRVGAAVVVSPVFLFSKKRKHYVTLHFNDEAARAQAAVFELSKGTYQQIIAALEAKTGLKTEYETEEAKKEK